MAKSKTITPKSAEKLKPITKNAKVTKSVEPKSEKMSADFEEFPSSDEEDGEFQGLESSDNEEDDEEEEEGTKTAEQVNKEIEKIKVEVKKNDKKKNKKKAKGEDEADPTKPRVVYVGRIPHGFYEEQMRAYFSQFGPITKLRLSRNKKSGKSKHYAFIEFENQYAAEAVVDVMNGYLLFGHVLQVRAIPWENVHERLFVGANKSYKAIPWERIAKYQHDKPKQVEKIKKLQEKHDQSIKDKNLKLKELGIDYEYTAGTPKKASKSSSVKKSTPKRKAKK